MVFNSDRAIQQVLDEEKLASDRGDVIVAELKAATVALRDAALAQRKAAERYQAALQAFNRHVAPEQP